MTRSGNDGAQRWCFGVASDASERGRRGCDGEAKMVEAPPVAPTHERRSIIAREAAATDDDRWRWRRRVVGGDQGRGKRTQDRQQGLAVKRYFGPLTGGPA
jgi:hypothetical protein